MQERERILEDYSAKVFKNRKDHIIQLEETGVPQEIGANSRSIPGMMINRGCCYAGCKGVVLGPLHDVITITHGPIGCGFYTWGTRRNKAKAVDGRNFIEYSFGTDMQESDIVFGGEKKLKQAITEAVEIFSPKCVMICTTCPVGLIGDDVNAVAEWAKQTFGIECVAFSCEGYRGVSQSAGHHIANNGLMKHIIGTGDAVPHKGKHTINILGEYNIGGDGWETARVLQRIGYEVLNIFTGDGSYEGIKDSHIADLNLVMCHRSINYIAEMMQTKYGIDWLKINFIGIEETIRSLREMAMYFDDPIITAKTEEVIEDEYAAIAEDLEYYKKKLEGKTAGIFSGGSRSHHYQFLLKDIGIKTIISGYEFAHRDDYEGRDVIPDIKLDADSKNIEEITVTKDEEKYRVVIDRDRYEVLKETTDLEAYPGMFRDMEAGTVTVDDFNHYETERLMKMMKPDIFYSGIKDKYMIAKSGMPSRQIHSYDYSGPYSCFQGALNFARDSYMAIYSPAWGMVTAPWKTESTLMGTVGGVR